MDLVNLFKPNRISYRYQLEQSISVLKDFFIWFQILINNLQANSGYRSTASGLGLHPQRERYYIVFIKISRNMWFPTIWHFDMCSLKRACAASFEA